MSGRERRHGADAACLVKPEHPHRLIAADFGRSGDFPLAMARGDFLPSRYVTSTAPLPHYWIAEAEGKEFCECNRASFVKSFLP